MQSVDIDDKRAKCDKKGKNFRWVEGRGFRGNKDEGRLVAQWIQ